jgi:hypothetical protein
MTKARIIEPAKRLYRGTTTNPDRWSTWEPRQGDILVCTPPKSGTTWTQTILAMLVHGGPDLPEKTPVLSPWVDAHLGVGPQEVAATLEQQTGRRVVKTHTPADGFPIWERVTVIALYRHPLDVFFSLRKHVRNKVTEDPNHPMLLPVPESVRLFLEGTAELTDFDRDNLETVTLHYTETVLSGRVPGLTALHYSDMVRDGRGAVKALARAAGIAADDALIDTVTEATSFGKMKANAQDYAPVGGTGYWKSDAGFFDSASSRKWEGQCTDEELALFEERLAELVPDAKARDWLIDGAGPAQGA